MVIISTITANAGAPVVLREDPDSSLYAAEARVSRTRTLDGGVVIVHNGMVHGDRTLRVKGTLTQAETETLRTFFETKTEVTLSCTVGLFRGAIDRLTSDGGNIDISFLVKEKLA